MGRDSRAKELANLKPAVANLEHPLDAFEAQVGYRSKATRADRPASTDPQFAFANQVVAAMKNRITEDHAMVSMRRGDLS
jgi:hypothetical protein